MTGYRACQAAATRAAGCWPSAEFRVLGPFEVIAVGKPVPVSPGERTLLHVLLLFCEQPCPQDLLFAALCGDTWPADPVTALARCAARAARAVYLWAGITAWSGLYQASARVGVLDLDRFRRGRAQAALHEAPGCWRSPVIPGLPGAAEVDDKAIGLLEERHIAAHDLAGLRLRLGWHRRALPALRARAAAEPGCEQATAQLMYALLAVGRPFEAFAARRSLRRWLAAELRLEPGSEVRDLLRCVLPGTGMPSPRRPGPARPCDYEGRPR